MGSVTDGSSAALELLLGWCAGFCVESENDEMLALCAFSSRMSVMQNLPLYVNKSQGKLFESLHKSSLPLSEDRSARSRLLVDRVV